MKLSVFILFCVILTLQYKTADGNLGEFFGRVHGSVQNSVNKIRHDARTFFNLPEKNQKEENQDASSNIVFTDEETNAKTRTEQSAKPVEATTQPTTSTTLPAQNAPKNATKKDDKDGRENFSGGCVPGYMRTADGRCKPTFG